MNVEIERLRDENETLRETVRQLRARLSERLEFDPMWKLTPTEQRILCCFLRNGYVTRGAIVDVVYSDEANIPGSRVIDVHLHNIRRKLCTLGMTFRNVYGAGWELSEVDRLKLRRIVMREDAA